MLEGKFYYAGDKVPIGGAEGEVLVKIAAPHYYTAWRKVEEVIDQQQLADIISDDMTIDEGEYS
jgi:hypothetical protein